MKQLVILAAFCLLVTPTVAAAAPAKAAAKAPAKAAAKKAPAKAAAAKAPAKAAAKKNAPIPLYDMDSGSVKGKVPAKSALAGILKGLNIRVCVRSDVPPFGSLSSKGLSGFDVSLAKAVVDRISIDYKKVLSTDWSVISAGARISSLQQNQCDLVVAAFSYTAARAKLIGFSKLYLQTDKVLVSAAKITRKTPVIGLVKGTTGTSGIKGSNRFFNNYQSIIYAMERGEVDYIVTDRPIALHMIRSVNKAYKISKVLAKGAEKYAIGVNKANAHLLKAINRALTNIAASGLLAHLHRKWL